jgi:hypothetical protein
MPRALRGRCLADPDALLEITRQARDKDGLRQDTADRFSTILHDLRMGAAWKRTARGRLRRTEEMLCTHIRPERRHDLALLDIGASDGITTVDGVRALRSAFGDGVRAVLADRNLWLLRYHRGPIVEYRAADGEPIMARFGPIGMRLASSRRTIEPDNNPLARLYLRMRKFRDSMPLGTRISLVHPAAWREPGISVMELDCLVRSKCLENRFDAVRASNVLNLGYFALTQLHLAVGHLYAYLREGGCLVVSRNEDVPTGEIENGSVWLKGPRRFRWLQDFGTGSEIKSVVDTWSID